MNRLFFCSVLSLTYLVSAIDSAAQTFSLDLVTDLYPGAIYQDGVFFDPLYEADALGLEHDFDNGTLDNVNALSFSVEETDTDTEAAIYTSVDRVSIGLPGSRLYEEAQDESGAAGDIFQLTDGQVEIFKDAEDMDMIPGFLGEDLNALHVDSNGSDSILFYSIDALSPSVGRQIGTIVAAAPSTIMARHPGSEITEFAVADRIGIHPEDDLDALVVYDGNQQGMLDDGDRAYFSLSPFSPSVVGPDGYSAAAIYWTDFSGRKPIVWKAAEAIGLRDDDNLNALHTLIGPDLSTPPLCPSLDVSEGEVLYCEDFENLSDGDLIGQGAWTGDSMQLSSSGTNLRSRVVNGIRKLPPDGIHIAHQSLTLPDGGTVELSFDAFARTSPLPRSHNGAFGFSADSSDSDIVIWSNNTNDGQQEWTFQSFAGSGEDARISGGHDTPVSLSIVLDYENNEIFGKYDFGSGIMETPRITVDPSGLRALNELYLWQDYRDPGRTGVEFDNFLLRLISVVGDCNGDGVVDAADLECACASGTLGDVLAATGLIPGDLNGDGTVAFADFLELSRNFASEVDSYTDGDINCDGMVAFSDFLDFSNNFGLSSERATSVPEPDGGFLLLVALLSLLFGQPKRSKIKKLDETSI